jgi:hypothetical protein
MKMSNHQQIFLIYRDFSQLGQLSISTPFDSWLPNDTKTQNIGGRQHEKANH